MILWPLWHLRKRYWPTSEVREAICESPSVDAYIDVGTVGRDWFSRFVVRFWSSSEVACFSRWFPFLDSVFDFFLRRPLVICWLMMSLSLHNYSSGGKLAFLLQVCFVLNEPIRWTHRIWYHEVWSFPNESLESRLSTVKLIQMLGVWVYARSFINLLCEFIQYSILACWVLLSHNWFH